MTIPAEMTITDSGETLAHPNTYEWELLTRIISRMGRDPKRRPSERQTSTQLANFMKAGLAKDMSILSKERVTLSRYSALTTPQPTPRPELFLLSSDTINSISDEDLDATYTDMEELGIAKLPYPITDIGLTANRVLRLDNANGNEFDGWELKLRFHNEKFTVALLIDPKGIPFDLEYLILNESVRDIATYTRKCLIVLLATKNIIKKRSKDRLLAAGVSSAKKNKFRSLYTTTISIPHNLPAETTGPGAIHNPHSVRPHLRRGHIRRQKYGPQLSFTKSIWIEPVFVNADASFVSSRTAYNTTLALPAEITLEQPPNHDHE